MNKSATLCETTVLCILQFSSVCIHKIVQHRFYLDMGFGHKIPITGSSQASTNTCAISAMKLIFVLNILLSTIFGVKGHNGCGFLVGRFCDRRQHRHRLDLECKQYNRTRRYVTATKYNVKEEHHSLLFFFNRNSSQ